MIRWLVLFALLVVASPARANVVFTIFDTPGQSDVTRYGVGDLVSIAEESPNGIVTPNTGPFRLVLVITTRTAKELQAYVAPKTSGQAKRREYYLDTTKMSAADLATWNANRFIQATEAVAIGWVTKK